MIRIFIFCRNMERLHFLQRIVVSYFQKERHTYRLTVYGHYRDAEAYLTGTGREDDLFFLDFSDFKAGLSLAGTLREGSHCAFWVLMDNSVETLCQSLLLQPSAYIADTSNEKVVTATLRRLEKYYQLIQKRYYFNFKCEGEYLRIPFDEISYFESNAKKVTLHQAQSKKQYHFSAKLDDIAEQLSADFLRCHQSYLVNMRMIHLLDTQNHVFLLHSNEEILISRRSYRDAKERYEAFLSHSFS